MLVVAETLWNLFFIDKTFILINDPTIVIAKYYLKQNGIHCVEQGQFNFTHEYSVKIILYTIHFLSHSKHVLSSLTTIVLYSENYTKRLNTLCGRTQRW